MSWGCYDKIFEEAAAAVVAGAIAAAGNPRTCRQDAPQGQQQQQQQWQRQQQQQQPFIPYMPLNAEGWIFPRATVACC
jgi:hypothetical protein